MKHPSRAAVVAGFAAIYFLWGSTYLAIRFAVATISPFFMAGTRHLAAGAILHLYARRTGAPKPSLSNWKAAAGIGTLLLLAATARFLGRAARRVRPGRAHRRNRSVVDRRAPRPPERSAGRAARPRGARGRPRGRSACSCCPRGPALTRHRPARSGRAAVAALSWSIGSLQSRRADLPRAHLLATGMEALTGGAALWISALGRRRGPPPRVDHGPVRRLPWPDRRLRL